LKKILYIWKGPYPWEIRIKKVCETLAASNYDVTVLSRWNFEEKQNEVINNVKIHRVAYNQKPITSLPIQWNPFWFKEIEKQIRRERPDLIIVREFHIAVSAGKAARKYNIPIIMDMAENYPAAMRDFKKYNSNFLVRAITHTFKIPDMIEKQSVKLMDGIIVVCEEQIKRLNTMYGYSPENISVVHNTPTADSFQIEEKVDRTEDTLFIHHGWMTAEKSLTKLIEAFVIALERNSNIKLILAGDGECENDYKAIALTARLNNKIIFTGKYDYNMLNELINTADFGVIPYQINEFNQYTIHNKIFDYFALGKPVIVSKVNPLMRIIKETGAGIIADCESAENFAEVIVNHSTYDYKKMSENALNAYKNKYNWERDAVELLSFIGKFI